MSMNWNERLAKLRKARGLSQKETAEAMSAYLDANETVSLSAVSSWEQGRTQPQVQNALALAAVLDVDPVSLFGNEQMLGGLNEAGRAKLSEYRQLLLDSPRYRSAQPASAVRLLPVYLQAASAGTGQWLDDGIAENMEVDESVPHGAEFGVRLAGDSMEPRFADGQIVWARETETAEDGEIVLCYLDGQSYCKKLRCSAEGVQLISLNTKYSPIDVPNDCEFRVFGVVVG